MNDGTGDEVAGDGVFTSASVRRIKAEAANAAGRRRATAADFALLEIVDSREVNVRRGAAVH